LFLKCFKGHKSLWTIILFQNALECQKKASEVGLVCLKLYGKIFHFKLTKNQAYLNKKSIHKAEVYSSLLMF